MWLRRFRLPTAPPDVRMKFRSEAMNCILGASAVNTKSVAPAYVWPAGRRPDPPPRRLLYSRKYGTFLASGTGSPRASLAWPVLEAGARRHPAGRRRVHQENPRVHHRDVFNSPLTDYLPASKTVPTPKAVLGDIAGAPGMLPYRTEVYRYMRMLENASPRVKVFSIGKTEEGREMIAVAVAGERLHRGARREPRTPGQAGRPAHHPSGRRRSRKTGGRLHAHLLHHRHHPLHRNRRAHRAHGTGLPPGGG